MLLGLSSEIFSWVRGALLILALYHLMIFLQNRKTLYLYYSLYLISFFIYFLKDVATPELKPIYTYINFSIQFLGFTAYIAFGRKLFNTKKYIPEWDILLVIEQKVLLALALVFVVIQLLYDYTYQEKLFIILAPIFTVFSILTYIVLTKIKGRHVMFFIIGSLTYITLANVSLLGPYVMGENYFQNLGIEPMFFTYLGAILETTAFALIIGYSARNFEKEKLETEIILESKVREMNDLKMTVLQGQMDPHFLYNSLNSINNFVLQNDVEKASDYITKFSRLIREILRNSTNRTVSLTDDLGVMGLYVKLEQMRMPGGFDYVVTIDENLDLDEILVPPLFLQPYIENAIWHGFSGDKEAKRITLNIYDDDDKILCEIIDNGIGIKNAKAKKRERASKPFGLKVSEDRIKLLHENQNVYVVIEDISTDNETGTRVTIKFPKKL